MGEGRGGEGGSDMAVLDVVQTPPHTRQDRSTLPGPHSPDVIVPAAVDAADPEVAVLGLQEGGGKLLHQALPHAHGGAAVRERPHLRFEFKFKFESERVEAGCVQAGYRRRRKRDRG